jgi:Ca-activated chloride channel family protein
MTNDRDMHAAGHDGGDPRLTAYALGELEGAEHAEARAEIEALVERDAGARDEVARVREMADTLRAELAAEAAAAGPAPSLDAAQHAALDAALAQRASGAGGAGALGMPRRRPVLLRYAPALAATLLVGMALWAAWDWNVRAESVPASGPGKPVASADLTRQDETASKPRAIASGGGEGNERTKSVAEAESSFLYDALGGQGGGGGSSRIDSLDASTFQVAGEAGRPVASSSGQAEMTVPDGTVLFTRDGQYVGMAPAAPAATPPTEQPQTASITSEEQAVLSQLGYIGYSGGSGAAVGGAAPAQGDTSAGHVTGRGRLGRKGALADGQAVVGVKSEALAYVRGDESDADGEEVLADAADDKRHAERRHELRYWRTAPTPGTEYYAPIVEAGFQSPYQAPLSTFSVDVDTAAYANVRRFLNQGGLPPKDAVRIEELVNYFRYDYAPPEGGADGRPVDGAAPFATHVAVAECPWAPTHRLVRIGIKGLEIPQGERAASNLVFLVDVSGSMSSQDKLPLLVASLKLLVNRLDERDRVALVTYAGNAGLVLESTRCDGPGRTKVLDALERLKSGGSTHGSAGIQLAYQTATAAFEKGGINRVVLATDGDFNVGVTDREDLHRLITGSARSGVFLSVLGFGTGNLKDGTAELLADKGNGNYNYIDSLGEAQKVLVKEMGGTLVTIAKDVKLQVEFNPAKVEAYRLIGYENRTLAAQDFNDDKKDAGEIGAGHTVTALYEVVPPGAGGYPSVDELKYQESAPLQKADLVESADLLNVKLRWKAPDGEVSTKLEVPVVDEGRTLAQAGPDMAFAAAVASFGMLLRGSDQAGSATWDTVLELAERGRGADKDGYRAEFLRLAQVAKGLTGN